MRLPRQQFTVRQTMVAVAVVGIALVLLDVARQPFARSDWVEVTVRNVPRGLRQFYLIADGPEGPHALNWYHSMVTVWTDDPRKCGQSWYWNYPDEQRFAPVRWPDAERFGALAQRRDGTWALWWLSPDDLVGPSPARYLVGGGRAEVRLPDASQARAPTQELLKRVGVPDSTCPAVTPGS
jgi:hypothetical protein